MMMKTDALTRLGLCAIVLAGLSQTAEAQRFGAWLDTSPVRAFTDDDWTVMRARTREALDEGEQGETFSWQNETTGASGSVTLREDSEHDGMKCRRAKFYNSADGMSGTSIHRLCRIADGSWRVGPP